MEKRNVSDNIMQKSGRFYSLVVFVFFSVSYNICIAGDWPTYRYDITRSGVSSEIISPQLSLQWTYKPTHKPKPAWPMPAEEIPRTHPDNAYHPIIADGKVFFGSSITDKVYAIDAATGDIAWTFFADGPVRFAPSYYKGRVYIGSDDGYVYCLNAKDGKLVWKYRPGPSNEKVIGNGRMISLWPIRTGVLVDDGAVYCTAGVFPFEGIYICALNADDGSVIWKNDTVGDRAHELNYGGISPHGYLVASKDMLYVPSGRAMPAGFKRSTGEFAFYASPEGKSGGTWTLLDGDKLIAGVEQDFGGRSNYYKGVYDAKTGARGGDAFGFFPGTDMVLGTDLSYFLTLDGIYAVDRVMHSAAVKESNEKAQKLRSMGKEIPELRRRAKNADEKASEKINRRIDEIVRDIYKSAVSGMELKDSGFKWYYSHKGLSSMIVAKDIVFVGGEGIVIAINTHTGSKIMEHNISGKVVSMAAAGGNLVVCTEEGPIYCFGPKKTAEPKEIKTKIDSCPWPKDKFTETIKSAVQDIVENTGIKKGYCVVLDCGEGRLACELARQTDLQIIGIEKDSGKLDSARNNLEQTGLLGTRVVVEPWDLSSLPEYFANLVVSEGRLTTGQTSLASKQQIEHILHGYRGLAYIPIKRGDNIFWKKIIPGKLWGAGSWTQQYGNPQNTACSDDELVKGPLGLLWFGEPGPKGMVDRHARAASPVSMDGRLFVQGEEKVMAYDAYNGTFLWERELPGAVRVRVDVDGGNLSLTKDALYVAAYDKSYSLDPATGETLSVYEVPPSAEGTKRRWGYISCIDNVLFGTAATPLKQDYAAEYKAKFPVHNEEEYKAYHRYARHWNRITDFPHGGPSVNQVNALTERIMAGDILFATDVKTGKILWTYQGKLIPNISLTIAEGIIFFVESKPDNDEKAMASAEKQELIKNGVYEESTKDQLPSDQIDVRVVVAIDASTGNVLWKKPLDVTGCGGDKMGTAYKDGILLFFGQFSNHDAEPFLNNELTWRRITALSTKTQEVLWSRPLNYLRRPLVVGDKVIIEPRACELRTGRIVKRKHPVSGEEVQWQFLRPGHCCSITSASADTLFYRSYWVAIYELTDDKGLSLFGGIRPGCWINMIPANGLMLAPEASSGCTCSFPLRCSFALVHKPKKVTSNWTVFIDYSDIEKVEHLALNMGAPGDMRDKDDTLWVAYPRPKTVSNAYKGGYGDYAMKVKIADEIADGGGYFYHDYRGVKIAGTDKPWLYTSGCKGLLRCEIPLAQDSAEKDNMLYTVRLGFNIPPGKSSASCAFDIKINGEVTEKNVDIGKTTGKSNTAVVKHFAHIPVQESLKIELVPKVNRAENAPIINFVEVIKEDKASGNKPL